MRLTTLGEITSGCACDSIRTATGALV